MKLIINTYKPINIFATRNTKYIPAKYKTMNNLDEYMFALVTKAIFRNL